MPSAWNKLVKKVFDRERKKNANFKLGDAMKMAAKERKKGGDGEVVTTPETTAPVAEEKPTTEVKEVKEETSAPVAETSAPVAETSAPVAETPAPVAETPAPVAETPAPVAETPAPVAVTGGKKTRKGGRKGKARKTGKKRGGK
jgi:hypothetical protein